MDSLDCDSFYRSLHYLLFTYYAKNDTWSYFVGIGTIYATQSNRMDCIFVLANLCLFKRLRWSSQLVSIVTAMATIRTTIVCHLFDSHASHDDGSCISAQTRILFCSIHCKLTISAYQLFLTLNHKIHSNISVLQVFGRCFRDHNVEHICDTGTGISNGSH